MLWSHLFYKSFKLAVATCNRINPWNIIRYKIKLNNKYYIRCKYQNIRITNT